MSTKIYETWRLVNSMSPFDALGPLWRDVGAHRLLLDAQWQVDVAAEQLNARALGTEHENFGSGSALLGASLVIAKEQSQLSPVDRSHDAHRFELALLRDPADHAQRYAHGYFEHLHYRAAMDRFAVEHGWANHAYWNNTDQPYDIDKATWDARGADWERLLPWTAVPADVGLVTRVGDDGAAGPAPFVMGLTAAEYAALAAASSPPITTRLARRGILALQVTDPLDTPEIARTLADRVRPLTFQDLSAEHAAPAHDLTRDELAELVRAGLADPTAQTGG